MFPADLVTFTEEILNGKLHFFFAVTLAILASLVKMNIFKLLGILANSAPQPEEKKK